MCFEAVQLAFTCKMATSFLNWLSCLVGKRSLSITLTAMSLPVFRCLPDGRNWAVRTVPISASKQVGGVFAWSYLHTQLQIVQNPELHPQISGTLFQCPAGRHIKSINNHIWYVIINLFIGVFAPPERIMTSVDKKTAYHILLDLTVGYRNANGGFS